MKDWMYLLILIGIFTVVIILVTPMEAKFFEVSEVTMYIKNIVEAFAFIFGCWVGYIFKRGAR